MSIHDPFGVHPVREEERAVMGDRVLIEWAWQNVWVTSPPSEPFFCGTPPWQYFDGGRR